MSKPTDQILLVPGETGWEIWTSQAEAAFTLHSASSSSRASELIGIPSGDILMFFPVKAITAIPMKVTSEDDSLFPELAVMHAERLGIRLPQGVDHQRAFDLPVAAAQFFFLRQGLARRIHGQPIHLSHQR